MYQGVLWHGINRTQFLFIFEKIAERVNGDSINRQSK